MSAVARRLAALVLCAAVLTGCGDGTDSPAPSEVSPTTSSEATTAEPDTDAVSATSPPTATSATVEPTTAAEPAPSTTGTAAPSSPPPAPAPAPAEPTGTPSAPPPTTAPPEAGVCTGDVLSQDILGFPGGVQVYFCDGDWAYAVYPDAPAAPELIAERVDGRWLHAVTIGDPVCADDLTTRGAPPAIAKLLPGCEEPAPTAPPTAPPTSPPPTAAPTEPPAPDCVVPTVLYGDTLADLTAVTCSDATAEWGLAEANAQPSWTVPWVTPTGWTCYVTPHDPTSKAAGACYAPEGNGQFTLYVQ